jgi:hypothetical protein
VTHRHVVKRLARKHPEIAVDADVPYLANGDVMTSAGTTSELTRVCMSFEHDWAPKRNAGLTRRQMQPSARPSCGTDQDEHGCGGVRGGVRAVLWPLWQISHEQTMMPSNRHFHRRESVSQSTACHVGGECEHQ